MDNERLRALRRKALESSAQLRAVMDKIRVTLCTEWHGPRPPVEIRTAMYMEEGGRG